MSAEARSAIYLESRYRKLVRGLPQTIHYCPTCKGDRRRRRGCPTCSGRGRLSADSVQEIIERVVLPAFRADSGKFHGAGREDVDVLMLGQGRPFVCEVIGPSCRTVDLEQVLADIHAAAAGRIELAPLQPCSRERVAFWKAVPLAKTYRARVALTLPAGGAAAAAVARAAAVVGPRLDIDQRTPTRVAHRRGDSVRARWVQVQSLAPVADAHAEVVLRCAHGTYVKEWISGDGGRTRPSLAEVLGVPACCEALDVLDVLLEGSEPAPVSATLSPPPA